MNHHLSKRNRWRLTHLCREATGRSVDVLVTDCPEWEHRVNHVGWSLEASINAYGSWLFRNEPSAGRVNLEKEIGMPKTDFEEAATHLESIHKALCGTTENCSAYVGESSVVDGAETVDYLTRKNRLVTLCSESALAIEHSIKCLTAVAARQIRRLLSLTGPAPLLEGPPLAVRSHAGPRDRLRPRANDATPSRFRRHARLSSSRSSCTVSVQDILR